MKKIVLSLLATTSFSALAANPAGLICRDDRRLENGPLQEIILSPSADGYVAQWQYMASLNSSVEKSTWAKELSCKIDAKAALAFCENKDGTALSIKERRETFYDSLGEDAKKKSTKHTDISVHENGVQKNAISFSASHCQNIGG
jgi:hypothetical protein